MRILLTGGDGQLARDLCSRLTEDKIVALSHTALDICDAEAVRAAVESHRPDCIVNTAAYHRVDNCEDEPGKSFATNAVGVYHLACAASAAGAALVHFSTDYVFDGTGRQPYVETDAPCPLSVYALSKRAGEVVVERYCESHFLVRTCGLYGPGSNRSKGGNFVERMLRLAKERKQIRVVNDQVLTPTSTVELAQKLAPLIHSNRYGLYHMTNTGECSWYEFTQQAFRLAGLSPAVEPVSSEAFAAKARRPPYSVLDNRAYRAAGYPDFRPWQEALAEYMRLRQA